MSMEMHQASRHSSSNNQGPVGRDEKQGARFWIDLGLSVHASRQILLTSKDEKLTRPRVIPESFALQSLSVTLLTRRVMMMSYRARRLNNAPLITGYYCLLFYGWQLAHQDKDASPGAREELPLATRHCAKATTTKTAMLITLFSWHRHGDLISHLSWHVSLICM